MSEPMSEKVTFFSAMSPVDAKLTAIKPFPLSLLLLLLLLLARVQHAPFGERDGLPEHLDVADVIGEHQHQRSIKVGALGLTQSAMRLDDGAERVIWLGEIGGG